MFKIVEVSDGKIVLEWKPDIMDYLDLNNCIGFMQTSRGIDVRVLSEKHGIALHGAKRLKITIEAIG